MTQKTLHEAVNILRDTKLGSCVELVISRQIMPQTSTGILPNGGATTASSKDTVAAKLPREILNGDDSPTDAEQQQQANSEKIELLQQQEREQQQLEDAQACDEFESNDANGKCKTGNSNNGANNRRQLLTFEIALNDTGSAGLGVSVNKPFKYFFVGQIG